MYRIKEELFYLNEHLHCLNYNPNTSESPVETINLGQGEIYQRRIIEPEIFMLLDGEIILSDDKKKEIKIVAGNMIMLPPGEYVHIETLLETYVLICRIKDEINLCEAVSLSDLKEYGEGETTSLFLLEMNLPLKQFTGNFVPFLEKGLRCDNYLKCKIEELMFYLRGFYTKEQMAAFFRPLLGTNLTFRSFILNNITHSSSTEELAKLANMSRTGFCGKFKRVMGESPSSYIIKYKSSRIRHELLCTSKTHKTLCAEFGFSSLNLFTRFCKKHLGAPPGRIRKEGLIEKD